MDIKQIQELVKLVNKSNIGELKIEKNDFKITIKQKQDPSLQSNSPQLQSQQSPQSFLPPMFASSISAVPQSADKEISTKPDNTVTVKSPMIGTFYRQAGPDKPVFISVGEQIEPGQVVCIIEAMKLFNEIESEVSGKIVKVLVEDASPVEFDQPLFLVEPS
ncbi:MAG TPA: acetyl-CoA carboxylase biotin carboxyl carrier protein [Chitinophagaceae bacterium]|nr:acetyl-CoA carboxylase biotin carboxyl carrier protein [Chitinophagaceae bacterium]